jgi:hypothetical protein
MWDLGQCDKKRCTGELVLQPQHRTCNRAPSVCQQQ